jgi:hypothetical protein
MRIRDLLKEDMEVALDEGGNVFAGRTGPIKLEDIAPTLEAYFAELSSVFPKKAGIFNSNHFIPLGSVGKKPLSGDIDLGVSASDLLDKEMSPEAISQWNIDPAAVDAEAAALQKRARTASPEQTRMKAFLKLLTLHINSHAKLLYCDEKKVTAGNIFGLFPQIGPDGQDLGTGVQIDWMVGDLNWLKFSYYSSAYPEGSNVKGLHRTQLMLSAFQVADLSFNHVSGVKDKTTGETIATDPSQALKVLNERLGTNITAEDAENYYTLFDALSQQMSPDQFSQLLNIYFKILDSTRADIPDNIQDQWLARKDELGLTGKFLPDDSKLKAHLGESGSTGADRVKSREDFKQFMTSYRDLIGQFPGFQGITPSGSYNSNLSKNDFGDIDLICHIKSDLDKPALKKQLVQFFMQQPETVIVPFTSEKHAGKRTYNSGEIVTVRYHDPELGYSAQIDNIIALDQTEATFKQEFLDMPAPKQGLVLGLTKIATLETPLNVLFKKLGINLPTNLPPNQEYEFNLSSIELQLRLVTYEPGTFKQAERQVVWRSQNYADLQKLLYQYDLNLPFDKLLAQAKSVVKNERSGNRIKGVFNSMISVKSGEVGTPKGADKEAARSQVDQTFAESKDIDRLKQLAGLS